MILNVVWNSPLNQKNKITPPSLRLVYDMHARIRCESSCHPPQKKATAKIPVALECNCFIFFSSFLYSNRTQNIFNIVWISRIVKVRSRSSSHPPHNTNNPSHSYHKNNNWLLCYYEFHCWLFCCRCCCCVAELLLARFVDSALSSLFLLLLFYLLVKKKGFQQRLRT